MHIKYSYHYLRNCTRIWIFLNSQLLLYAFSFHPHLSDKSSIRIATFFIRSPEWTFLNSLWIRNRVEAKSGHLFLSGFVIRSSPVLHNEYSRWCWGQCYRFFITCTSVSRSIYNESAVLIFSLMKATLPKRRSFIFQLSAFKLPPSHF